jgi:hypothetical protein
MKSKSIIVAIILLAVLLSGCSGPAPKPAPAPTIAPSVTVTAAPSVTATPLLKVTPTGTVSQAIPTLTPTPSGVPILPSFLYVQARMITPAYWGPGNYSLQTARAQITNQQTNPLSITAQIVNNGQVLEEKSFVLQQQGSSYGLTLDRQHYVTSTNVTLRLLVQGYQPVEYPFQIVTSII